MRNRDRVDPLVARLRPRVDASEGLDPARPGARELLATITEKNQEPAVAPKRTTRRLLIAVPVAAALAAAGVAATALMPTSAPDPVAPQEAAALEIEVDDGLVVAEVKNPTADPERYAEQFADHGLNVDLTMVPASPTLVGKLTYLDQNMTGKGTDDRDVEVIESPEKCTPNGICPVGVRIPEDYANPVQLAFGRAPEKGETYQTTNTATAPGEALEGVDVVGMTVDEAKGVLAEHGQEVAEYRVDGEAAEAEAGEAAPTAAPSPAPTAAPSPAPTAAPSPAPGTAASPTADAQPRQDTGGQDGSGSGSVGVTEKAEDVPGGYYVHDVGLWAPGEVLLFVGEAPK
ncbi:hypothetical protein [Streptomonospora wellingtoniae]|uniref:PASTA domain-containing protein n=1 Tax=Streptomonospora wellingtoniae TaxID=3075544 RepID=A0ABU2KZK2_9ACTN|nr:hypothetical protein [Streptomonospora sp. DSM 45055]MDT0304742.1 hypothetical protein [Streptomonospora sp. DSM 45055]